MAVSRTQRTGADERPRRLLCPAGAVVSFVFVIFAMFLLFRDGDRIVARIPDLPVTSVLPVAGAASSFFTVENQVSITALSSQLVRRLMLHVIPCASRLRATAPAVPAR